MPLVIAAHCANCAMKLDRAYSLSTELKPSDLPVRDEQGRWFCPPDNDTGRNCRLIFQSTQKGRRGME